jgi:hypothetical protein
VLVAPSISPPLPVMAHAAVAVASYSPEDRKCLSISPDAAAALDFATCPRLSLPRMTPPLHPPRPHCFFFRVTTASCAGQIPPFLTIFVQPSRLHCLCCIAAQCTLQTPPRWTNCVQPSRLHCFLIAPCAPQSPPLLANLGQPLWLQCFSSAPCALQTP